MSRDSSWKVEDVMNYFGEHFKEERDAKKVMESIGERSYFEKMNKVRDMLTAAGKDVPFRAVYRRAK